MRCFDSPLTVMRWRVQVMILTITFMLSELTAFHVGVEPILIMTKVHTLTLWSHNLTIYPLKINSKRSAMMAVDSSTCMQLSAKSSCCNTLWFLIVLCHVSTGGEWCTKLVCPVKSQWLSVISWFHQVIKPCSLIISECMFLDSMK